MKTSTYDPALLTQEKLKGLLHYAPDTGVFTWVADGRIVGTLNDQGYFRIRVDGRLHYSHRLAWLYMTGNCPTGDVDHQDRDRKNNKWSNLREATRGENHQNKSKQSNNRSGHIGVCFHSASQQWEARITRNRQRTYLGLFATPELASDAYQAAKKQIHTFNPVLKD